MKNNKITQSIIVGLVTLISALNWSGLKNILEGECSWILPTIGFLILLVFFSLNWILTESKNLILITIAFTLITFFFSFGYRWEYLIVLVVAFSLFTSGSYLAIKEKENRIKIQTGRIIKRGLPQILTALALIIASAYYFSPMAFQEDNQIEIPRKVFDIVIEPILIPIEGQIPVELSNGNLKDELYNMVNQQINRNSESYKEYLGLGLAIGFFFALKGLGVIFIYLVAILVFTIFKVLILTGAVNIQEKSVLKEVIEV